MGVKGAKTISIFPGASPPVAVRGNGASTLKNRVQLRLLQSKPATLNVPRRLPAAPVAGVSAKISDSGHAGNGAATGFRSVVGNLLLAPRGPTRGLKLPALHGAPANPGDSLPVAALANVHGSDVDSRMPVKCVSRLILGAGGSLPAAAGLRALQDAFPVGLDTMGPGPRSAANPVIGFSFRIAPSEAPPNPAPASRVASLAIQYCGDSFELLDSTASQPSGQGFEPYPFPVDLALFTLESGALAAADQSCLGEAVSNGLGAPGAAAFILEELDPLRASGFAGLLYVSSGFALCPVWLPALFDEPGGLPASLRLCTNPQPVLAPARSSLDLLPADGPGFSGTLACPISGAAIWEFPKTGRPKEVTVPEHVSKPNPPSWVVPNAAQGRPQTAWQSVLRFWRQTPAWARAVALMAALTVPALLVYRPNISLQNKQASALADSWAAAIEARATIDLRDDFQNGFQAWNGKPGWEKTWAIDGSGSAQPGWLALFNPTLPLTDYRLEFQGQIVSKALGMALRAADTRNYQAVKIGVLKPGPLSTLSLTRYPVIEGREGPKTEVGISLTVRSDTLYKVLVLVQGDHFQVRVNDVLADAWTDDRFKSGGVGFFTDKGELALVRTVHVIDKEDFLGRLCYQVSQWIADRRISGEKHE